MPTIGQMLGDDGLFTLAYGPQYNAMLRKKALDESGYVPNENDGLIDSFQSGLAGSVGGLFGEMAGWSKDKDYDWINNNAMWAANQMGDIAARNAYTGSKESDGYLWYGANQAASALGSSVPSLVADVAMSSAADAALGSVVPGLGTTVGGAIGAVSGVAKWGHRLYEGSKAVQYGAKAAKVAGSIAVGGLVENASNAGDTYMTGLSRGMSHEDAWNASNQAFEDGWAPAVLNYASDKISLGMPMKGISAAMAVGKGGRVLAKTAGAWAGNAMIGATGEGLTEAWQQQIQEQALGNKDYDNVHIYDPRTWTDEMKEQGEAAFAGSLVLGGIGGGIQSARGLMANRANTNVNVNDAIDTSINLGNESPVITQSQESPQYEYSPLSSAEPSDLGISDLGSLVPDAMAPQERGDYDEVFAAMDKRFNKSKYADEEIATKNQAVSDTVDRISALWDNSPDEKTPNTLKYGDFIDDFIDAGLTKQESVEASKAMVKAIKSKKATTDGPVTGAELVQRADNIGYKLTDAQRQDLLSDKPIKSNYNEVFNGIERAEVAEQRRQTNARINQAEAKRRAEYSDRYSDSINKPFLDTILGDKAEDTGYRISRAIANRNDDVKHNRRAKSIDKYLSDEGITKKNYTPDEIKNIKAQVKSIEEAKTSRGLGKEQLKKLSADNANVSKSNEAYNNAIRQFDKNDPRNRKKIQAVNEVIAHDMIRQGKEGKPIYRYKKYTEFKNSNKSLYNKINEEVYGDKIKTKKEQMAKALMDKKVEPKVAVAKPKFKEGSISDKIAKGEIVKDTAPKIEPTTKPLVNVNPKIQQENKQLNAAKEVKETSRKNKPKRTDTQKGKEVLSMLANGEITPNVAREAIAHIRKNARQSHIENLDKFSKMIKANTNDKGELRTYDRTENGRKRDESLINERIAKLQKEIDDGNLTNKEYDKSKKDIEKQIERFETNHLGNTDESTFSIPKFNRDNRLDFVAKHDKGEVKHPQYVTTAVLKRPGHIDEALQKWVKKELNKTNDTKFNNGEKARYIKNVLVKEYNDLIEGTGSPENAYKTNPTRTKHLAHAIAGSFPKQSFGPDGNRIRDNRKEKMWNGGEGLTQTQFSEKDKLIAFAKRYFKGDLTETKKEEPKPKVQKEDKRKNNVVGKKASPVVVSSIKPTGELMQFHFVLNGDVKSDYSQFLNEIGIDEDSVENIKTKGDTTSFDAEVYLGGLKFDGTLLGDISGDYLIKDITNARESLLKEAINSSPNKSIILDTTSVAGLKNTLDKLFKKDQYVIEKVDNGILIHPVEIAKKDAIEDASYYQFGVDDANEGKTRRAYKDSGARQSLQQIAENGGQQFSSKELATIESSLLNTSPSFNATKNFLSTVKNVLNLKKQEDGDYNGSTNFTFSIIRLLAKNISPNSSTMVHETTHYAVKSLTDNNNINNNKKSHVLWKVLDNTLKDWRTFNEKRRSESQDSVQSNQRVHLLEGQRQDNSRNDSRTQTSSQGSNGVSTEGLRLSGYDSGRRRGFTADSNGENTLRSTTQDVNRESGLRNEEFGGTRPNESIRWGVYNGIDAIHHTDAQSTLRELRHYTESVLNGDLERGVYIEKVRTDFVKIEVAPDMYMSEKANALLSIIDEVAHVDLQLGLKGKDRLSYRLLVDESEKTKGRTRIDPKTGKDTLPRKYIPSRLFQESLAYASHTFMSKGTYEHLMNTASNNFNEAGRNVHQKHQAYGHVAIGTMNADRFEDLFFRGGIDKKSIGVLPTSSVDNMEGIKQLQKYKKNAMVLKATFLDGKEYFMFDSDMHSYTDRRAKTKVKENGVNIKDVIRENRGLLGINPKKNGSALAFTALVSNQVNSLEEAKERNTINGTLPDTSKLIVEQFVSLAEQFAHTKTKNILASLDNIKDKENYLLGYITSQGSSKPATHVLKRKDFVGGIFNAMNYLGQHPNAIKGAMKVFKQHSGINSTKVLADGVERLAYLARNNKRGMSEVKMVDKITPHDLSAITLDEADLGTENYNRFKKEAEKYGIKVLDKNNGLTLESATSKGISDKSLQSEVNFQHGKEDDANISVLDKAQNTFEDLVEAFNKKHNDNITFEARDDKQGNISGYGLKKWLRSPVRFIEKYIPQMKPIVYWANQARVKQDKLHRKYIKALDKIKTNLGKENIESFNKLAKEVTQLGREFVQPASVMYRDREVYINITDKDIFREFKDEVDAKNLYNELKKTDKHVFMDYKDGNFRVFASDNAIKPFSTWEQAHKASLKPRDEAMRAKGYNEKVIQAYNAWRTLDNNVFDDSVKAWQTSGADPEHKPKRLWGHIPMIHSRYGVYLVKDNIDEDGNAYEQREKIASFHTYKDAENYVKDKKLNGDTRVVITERNPQYDERLSTDMYDNSYDSAYDDIVYEGESREAQEKRFARISHSYPEIKKIIEEFVGKKEHVTRESLMELVNDSKKQRDLGINHKLLEEELKHANLDELFRRRDVITRQDIIGHLLLGYGNLRTDKYNKTRKNAQGANPNVFENMENYLRYKSKFVPIQEFYHKSTSLYRSVIGTDYASQFGVNGEGARRDVEEVLHKYISSVIGLPNNADKAVNRAFNELLGDGWIKKTYGETFITDLMNRSMEAVTVAKLGLFRPTAAIAQLGALMNIATKTGYTKEFANAVRDATMLGPNRQNVTMAEKRMFNNIGLNLEDNAMETQSLKNRKSIYNLKVGNVKLGKLFETSMEMFNRMDKYTRRVAALHAFRKAIAEGKSQTEAEHIAYDFVRDTNFDYSDSDASELFTRYGTFGKLILQFKKYSIKELEFMYDIVKSGNKKEMARFLGSYMTMAGLMGIPGISASDPLAEWITGKKNTDRAKELMMEWAGKDPTKKQLALLAMYGAPAPTIGVDFSRNIGVGDLIPTDNFLGPTFGTIGNMMTSIKNHNTANGVLLSMAHDLSPAFANYYQSATGKKRNWAKGVDTRDYSDKERVLKFIGFRPILDAVDSDMSQINYANSQNAKSEKKALIYQYINDPKSVSTEELKAHGITKKQIADAKKNLAMTTNEKSKRYSSKADRKKNKEHNDAFEGFEEDLN